VNARLRGRQVCATLQADLGAKKDVIKPLLERGALSSTEVEAILARHACTAGRRRYDLGYPAARSRRIAR
jgi:hypothetical protein